MFTKQKIVLIALGAASIALCGVAGATTASGTTTVSADLTAACSVSAATITFPTFSTLAGVDQTGDSGSSLQVACSNGLTPLIYATGTRAMVDGASHSIAFNLSLASGAAADDLPSVVGSAVTFGLTQDGSAHAVMLYARAPVANFTAMPSGTYTSSPITVTVSY